MNCLILDCDLSSGKDWECYTKSIPQFECVKEVEIQGEALSPSNIGNVYNFVSEFKRVYPDKKVTIYTLYNLDDLKSGDSYLDRRRLSMIQNYVDEVLAA